MHRRTGLRWIIGMGDRYMDFKDYYKILAVEPTADDKAIKTALALLHRRRLVLIL